MMDKKIQDALNDQLNYEAYSASIYWSMAAYFESLNLRGFAQWMKVQSQEEMGHAQKLFGYIVERGGRVTLQAVDAPKTDWDSPLAAFEDALRHERKVTARIHKLVDQALAAKDHATASFLQWFVNEQVQEEAAADNIVHSLKLIDKSTGGLFMLDHQLGSRK